MQTFRAGPARPPFRQDPHPFDSYSLLGEGHDVLQPEGTLVRPKRSSISGLAAERAIQRRLVEVFHAKAGMVLVAFSGQHIDRLDPEYRSSLMPDLEVAGCLKGTRMAWPRRDGYLRADFAMAEAHVP